MIRWYLPDLLNAVQTPPDACSLEKKKGTKQTPDPLTHSLPSRFMCSAHEWQKLKKSSRRLISLLLTEEDRSRRKS